MSRYQRKVLVKNRTSALQLAVSEVEVDVLRLQLKNTSRKAINGYTLSFGDGTTEQTDYTIGDQVIAPDQVEERRITLSRTASRDAAAAQHEMEVLAVVFTDNSSEGDNDAAVAILDTRKGLAIQERRLMPLLEEALKATDANLPSALATLKSRLAALPDPPESKLSLAVKHGLHDAKEGLVYRIQELEQGRDGGDFRGKLVEMKKHMEKRAARSQAAVHQ
jgi:Tfp pilus assembly major pilin PilA